MRNIKIALFGSSIMEGRLGVEKVWERYYMLLQQKLSERFPEVCFSMINGAIGGWSTRELMNVFEEQVLKYSPDYCIVMFGANNHDCSNPARTLKEGEFHALMNDFQKRLPESCRRIGVVLNPIINERHWVTKSPVWQNSLQKYGGMDEMCEEEREEARAFYRENNYPYTDLSKLMREEKEKYICGDGIHLSEAGQRFFADLLFPILEELLICNNEHTNGR